MRIVGSYRERALGLEVDSTSPRRGNVTDETAQCYLVCSRTSQRDAAADVCAVSIEFRTRDLGAQFDPNEKSAAHCGAATAVGVSLRNDLIS